MLRRLLEFLIGCDQRQYQQGIKIMAAIDDLKKAVTDLNTSVSAELEAITAKLSSPAGTSDAEIEAVVAELNSLKSKIDAETAVLVPPVV
jgi:Skp family chaperone for outer membrane proteins